MKGPYKPRCRDCAIYFSITVHGRIDVHWLYTIIHACNKKNTFLFEEVTNPICSMYGIFNLHLPYIYTWSIWEWEWISCIHTAFLSSFLPDVLGRPPTTCGYFSFHLGSSVSLAFSLVETQFFWVSRRVWWTNFQFIQLIDMLQMIACFSFEYFCFQIIPKMVRQVLFHPHDLFQKLRFHHSCMCKRTAMVASIATPRRHDPAKIAAKCLEYHKCYHLACRHGSNKKEGWWPCVSCYFMIFHSLLRTFFS